MLLISFITPQFSPGGTSSANIMVQLFFANSTTAMPISGIQATQNYDVVIPVVPAYINLPLDTLVFSTAGITGVNYALVISVSSKINWHSVQSTEPMGLPTSGISDVTGVWVSS